ncbi:MAG: HAMP domain-containing protein [Acidobacteria bacterium]|nr:MAG: HAMP domain-containing protein [Acidobacteriota bacterium]
MHASSRRTRRFVPLHLRLAALFSLAVFVFGGLNLVVVGRATYRLLADEQTQRLDGLTQLIAERAKLLLLYDDLVRLDELLREAKSSDPAVESIVVRNDRGEEIVRVGRIRGAERGGARPATAVAPILGGRLGSVEVTADESLIRARTVRLMSLIAGLVLFLLTVGLVGAWVTSRRVTRPLRRIVDALAAYRLDGPPLRIDLASGDEFDEIAERIERIADQLQEHHREQRLRERELARAERLAALGRLTAGLAHEINNPLAAIRSAAQGLESRPEDAARVARYAQTIREVVDRLAGTTGRILGQARERPGRIAPEILEDCVREAAALASPRLRAAGATLALDEPGGSTRVVTDRHRLVQILLNLLLNAADAVQGIPEARVTVRIAGDADGARVEIRDNGPGVPPDLRERIFEPFFTTKEPGAGTGLGLAVAWSDAAALGGDLRLAEDEQSGACFVVELPLDTGGSHA